MDDHQEIEIPSHFLCPISMQLMRDPVTISTGITYDRESIEKWLSISCNKKVCPVTKQELIGESSGSDLTPNHTLRRLIQSWCTINASNGIERIPTPKPPLTKSQILKLINEAKKSSFSSSNNLQKLASIARDGSHSDKKCLVSAGIVEFLVSIIIKKYQDSDFVNDERDDTNELDALNILYHLVVDVPDTVEKIITTATGGGGDSNDYGGILLFTGSLMQILKCGSYRSRAYAIMLLKSIFSVTNYPIQLITPTKPEYFLEIISIVRDQISEKATKSALKLLIHLCPFGRNRIKAVEAGAVWVLIQLLLDLTDKRTNELILIMLDQLCRCAEGRAELLNHAAGLAIVSKKIFRVSHVASERSVRILASISMYSASPKVLQEMLQVGVVAKLCLVLQMECSQKTIERTKHILNLHSRVWKDSPCIPRPLLSSYPSS